MHTLYIIYSAKINRYYVGESEDFQVRLVQHNSGFFKNASTSLTDDWEEFLSVLCDDRGHARRLETFIKKQKSRVFIESLKSDPEKLASIVKRFR